jgi:hypothetical protein
VLVSRRESGQSLHDAELGSLALLDVEPFGRTCTGMAFLLWSAQAQRGVSAPAQRPGESDLPGPPPPRTKPADRRLSHLVALPVLDLPALATVG